MDDDKYYPYFASLVVAIACSGTMWALISWDHTFEVVHKFLCIALSCGLVIWVSEDFCRILERDKHEDE